MLAGLACPSETVDVHQRPVERPVQAADSVVLFFSGDTLGSLKPCGCSGGQLGGLEKRPVIFDSTSGAARLLIDTGSLVQDRGEQDLIKFNVLFEAFRLLNYDVVGLTAEDIDIASNLGLLAGRQHRFGLIAPQWPAMDQDRPRYFSREFRLSGGNLTVNVATSDAQTDSPEQAAALFASISSSRSLNVLLLQNIDAGAVEAWAQGAGADCIIVPSTSDEPFVLSEPQARPLVFTVGQFGRYICRVQADLSASDGALTLNFTRIPVSEDLPDAPALVQLYKQYQQLVGDSDLLEKHPRVPLPDRLQYVGSKRCESCHFYEYAMWSTGPHGDAFATLVEVGSDRDPECAVCHVVGMDYESGFITEEKTPHLKEVGCEVCHGPGSAHVIWQGWKPTAEPKAACLDCHTPEHSTGYAGNEDEYREKIQHWWEP